MVLGKTRSNQFKHLKDMTRRTKRRERLQTRSVALGRLQIVSLDNIGEALAIAEGEAYK
jgi:hypothetical protein